LSKRHIFETRRVSPQKTLVKNYDDCVFLDVGEAIARYVSEMGLNV
jgi:hypothetical protein